MPKDNDIDTSAPANSFVAALAHLEYGNLIPDASEKLAKLVSRVMTARKKGRFTLTLDVIPGKGDSGQIKIESEITLKEPKPEKGESMFFGTAQGQLLTRNPNQKEMPFMDDVPRPVASGE